MHVYAVVKVVLNSNTLRMRHHFTLIMSTTTGLSCQGKAVMALTVATRETRYFATHLVDLVTCCKSGADEAV